MNLVRRPTVFLREKDHRLTEGTAATGSTGTDRTGVIAESIEMIQGELQRGVIDSVNRRRGCQRKVEDLTTD